MDQQKVYQKKNLLKQIVLNLKYDWLSLELIYIFEFVFKIIVKRRHVQILKAIEQVLNQNRYHELIYSNINWFTLKNVSVLFQISNISKIKLMKYVILWVHYFHYGNFHHHFLIDRLLHWHGIQLIQIC
jgi:hypothetical protein